MALGGEGPGRIGPAVLAVFPATMVLPRVRTVSAVVQAAAVRAAELPLTVQSVSVVVPPIVVQAAAVVAGGSCR